jgi:hypothetical protein
LGTDPAIRLARVIERMGANLTLSATGREERLERVQDAWLRDLSPRSLTAASRELRRQRARVTRATAISRATKPRVSGVTDITRRAS